MKLKKVLCLFMMLAVVLSLASCALWNKLPFVKTKYTVAFDSAGGSEVESQTVVKGELATKPEDPTKEGHTFAGWFNGEEEWNFETPITNNLILVAHWEAVVINCSSHTDENNDGRCDNCSKAINYRILYIHDGVNLRLTPSSYNCETTELPLPTAPDKAHYVFTGWYSDTELTNKVESFNLDQIGNVTLYAKYELLDYKVTYYLDEGTNSPENPASYNINSLITELKDATRDGYYFRGWYTDANCTVPFEGVDEQTAGDLIIYAKWELAPKSYKITYLDHEGNELETSGFFVENSDQPLKKVSDFADYVLPEGSTFLYWLDTATDLVCYAIPADAEAGLVVRAVITTGAAYDLNLYVDRYLNASISVKFDENGLPNLPVPVKAGYTFDGWYTNDDRSGEKVTYIPAGTTDDVSVIGFYEPNEYTIKYYHETTELSFDLSIYTISETDIELPEVPELEGHIVKGWYTADGVKVTSIPAGSIGDLVLYAEYDLVTYTITYYLNGGENNDQNVTEYQYGNLPTLHDPLSRNGYTFDGWYTDATFSGKAIADISDCANRNVILYAKWTPISNNNGSSTLTPEVPF